MEGRESVYIRTRIMAEHKERRGVVVQHQYKFRPCYRKLIPTAPLGSLGL